MPYSELKPGRLRLEDESTGTAYLFIQKDDNLLWCDVSENILQVITNVKFGAKADRPTAGKKGLLYFATDTKEFFYDNGSSWVRVVSGETGLYDADRDTYLNVEPSSDADKIVGYTAGTQVLNISTAGILTLPKQSVCRVYMNNGGADLSVTATTWTKIPFDTVNFDVQNEFDTTNNRFTATESGKYILTSHVTVDSLTDQNGYFLKFYKNGESLSGAVKIRASGTSSMTIVLAGVYDLSSGDYVEVYTYGDTDYVVKYGWATSFYIAKVA